MDPSPLASVFDVLFAVALDFFVLLFSQKNRSRKKQSVAFAKRMRGHFFFYAFLKLLMLCVCVVGVSRVLISRRLCVHSPHRGGYQKKKKTSRNEQRPVTAGRAQTR